MRVALICLLRCSYPPAIKGIRNTSESFGTAALSKSGLEMSRVADPRHGIRVRVSQFLQEVGNRHALAPGEFSIPDPHHHATPWAFNTSRTSGKSIPKPLYRIKGGNPVFRPAPALVYCVFELLVPLFPQLPEDLHLLCCVLSLDVYRCRSLSTACRNALPGLIFFHRHRTHGPVRDGIMLPPAKTHLQAEDSLEVVDPLAHGDQVSQAPSSCPSPH